MPASAKHLVVEVRYPPTLDFYSKMDKIGLALNEAYPDWERSALALELRNKKFRRRCYLTHNRSFFEAVDFAAEGTEFDRARDFFERLHHEIRFTRILRVGIRQWFADSRTEPLIQLVKTVGKKFQPQSNKLDELLRGRIEDVAYVTDVRSDHGWKYKLRLGPMERKQWFDFVFYEPGTFESPDAYKKYQDSLPERMVFIDLDCFREDIPFSDLFPFVASVRTVSAEIVKDLTRYINE